MALDVKIPLRKTLIDLTREISKNRSELARLRKELSTYQKVQKLLRARPSAAKTKTARKVRRKPVDWNSVLKQLPSSFAVGNVANLAKIKSRTYMHRVLAKWIKQRKIKRLKLGRYQKL
jgi:hypothetical protein